MHAVALVALMLSLGLAAGCGGDDGDEASETTGAGAASFEGVPWLLTAGLDVDGWEDMAPSATFVDGTVGGSSGCNRYTAPYTVDGDALDLGVIASTQMACVAPADAVERAYLAALEEVAEWQSEDSELVLLDSDGGELLRYAAATPVGDWELTTLQTGTALVSLAPGTEITATFADDGTLSGSAGCNNYNATYTTDNGGIEITEPAGTRKFCAEPEGVMAQEATYLEALPSAAQYRVDGNSLSLLAADGTYVAAYVRPAQP